MRGIAPWPTAALARVEDAAAPTVEVERPANAAFGDLATNLAMKLARPLRRSPLDIAEALAASLGGGSAAGLIASAEVARPGFVNLRVADEAYEGLVAGILAAPGAWGRIPTVNPRKVNVEFVSANPTGPLTVGNARGAFVGDLLCRVLEAGGQEVTREYYFNDSGAQVTHLGDSVVAVRRGLPVPEDGYKGAYVEDLAREVPDDVWAAAEAAGDGAGEIVGALGERARPGGHRGVARRGSVSASTSGRARRRCTTRAGWSGRWTASRPPARSTSRTAQPGSAPRPTATTRTA